MRPGNTELRIGSARFQQPERLKEMRATNEVEMNDIRSFQQPDRLKKMRLFAMVGHTPYLHLVSTA